MYCLSTVSIKETTVSELEFVFHLVNASFNALHSVVVNMRILSPTAQITMTAFFALAAAPAACVLEMPRNGTGTTAAVATLGSWSRSLLRALATVDRRIPTRELTGGFGLPRVPRSIFPLLAQSVARNAMAVRFVSVQHSHPA